MSPNLPPINVDELMTKIRVEVLRRKKERDTRARASLATPNTNAAYRWGTRLVPADGGNGVEYLREGWSRPEPQFVWSAAPTASIELPIVPPLCDLVFRIEAHALTTAQRGAQRIRFLIDGVLLAEWSVGGKAEYSTIVFQRHLVGKTRLILQFEFPEAFSPRQGGIGNDDRLLGIALYGFELELLPSA